MYHTINLQKYNINKIIHTYTSIKKVCEEKNKKCNKQNLELLNNCDDMKKHFPCNTCSYSTGNEQPAFVVENADQQFNPSVCLINSDATQSFCEAKHRFTIRLCSCE
jgi:hypothetical protein